MQCRDNFKLVTDDHQLSEDWYRPQLELAQWIEAEIPSGAVMVLDNIPACWIRRRPQDRTLISWFDVPVNGGAPDAFAQWLTTENVEWVLWFREAWTQAPKVAPFLLPLLVILLAHMVILC